MPTESTSQHPTASHRALPALPPGFLWGTATAAYQIEGAVQADGRGPSIWDTFCRVPGAIADGTNADVACDHYHRLDEDLDLMARLGADAYRFSIAWPRIQPTGRGLVEPRGLDFYQRLVDGLLERGIRPFVTLYHWDLPQGLEDLGGWRERSTAGYFAEYAAIVVRALGDRVADWITLNEPYCSSMVGYAEGRHAPGTTEGHGALAAAHHLLLGHGMAVAAVRANAPAPARIGLTLNMSPAVPVSDAPTDLAAAARQDLLVNRQFTEPVLAGTYPQEMTEIYSAITDFGFRHDGDLETISVPLDFLGVNYYYRIHVGDAPFTEPEPSRRTAMDIGVKVTYPESVPRTDLGWPIEPEGLTATLTGLRTRYPALPPVYVTENGRAEVSEGFVSDPERIEFIADHVEAIERAVAAGVDVRGYFIWSLMDNFEWARGLGPRFGLVHIDYPTGARTPKSSFHWLRSALAGRDGTTRSKIAGLNAS